VLAQAVAAIHYAGLHLPDGAPATDDLRDAANPTTAEWTAVFERVAAVPHVDDVTADAIADVWRDAVHGLRALALGAPPADVYRQWRHDFESHWGPHAVEALAALQQWSFE
jgi:hypothetical protein